MADEEDKKFKGEENENKFCPLCMKNRKASILKPMTFGFMGKAICKKDVCELCHVVMHNARRILNEAMIDLQKQQGEPKNESSGLILPRKEIIKPQ